MREREPDTTGFSAPVAPAVAGTGVGGGQSSARAGLGPRLRTAAAWGLALSALALAPLGAARAQDAPPPESDASIARKAELDKRLKDLEHIAAQLAADYDALIDERVRELARKNPTLKRLHEAGLFTKEAETAGLPTDPLSALPWLKKAYEMVDTHAQELQAQFGGEQRQHNERVALATLRKIARGQASYREEDRDGNGIRDYARDLSELARVRLFEKGTQNGFTANGYVFTIVHGDVLTYSATASPEVAGDSGDMFFYVDQTGVVRADKLKRAGPTSPAVPDK